MTVSLDGYDFVWASPPCQGYSSTRNFHPGQYSYPQLIETVRERLSGWGGDWVIENVQGAPLKDPVVLCGLMFGLRVYRHRLFETSFMVLNPSHIKHRETIRNTLNKKTVYTKGIGGMTTVAGGLFNLAGGSFAMGIDWMTRSELKQAIPPAYSEYIAGFAG